MSQVDITSRLANTSINKAATERINHDLKMAGYGNMNANDMLVQRNGHMELKLSTDQLHHGNKVVEILNKSLIRETGGKSFGNIKVRQGAVSPTAPQSAVNSPMPASVQVDNLSISNVSKQSAVNVPVQPVLSRPVEPLSPTAPIDYSGLKPQNQLDIATVRRASQATATGARVDGQDGFGQFSEKHGMALLDDIAHRIDSNPNSSAPTYSTDKLEQNPTSPINNFVIGINPDEVTGENQ